MFFTSMLFLALMTVHRTGGDGFFDCHIAKNISISCLQKQIYYLSKQAEQIRGNIENLCDSGISEQICSFCRSVNETSLCLYPVIDECSSAETDQFFQTTVKYLSTAVSLCKTQTVLQDIHEERVCFNKITNSSRICNKMFREKSCRGLNVSYGCSAQIAQAYCATAFNSTTRLKSLAMLYLRTIEPSLDMANCQPDSEVSLKQIYPEHLGQKKDKRYVAASVESTASYHSPTTIHIFLLYIYFSI